MNISSINNNLPGATPRPVAAEAPATEVRQARAAQASGVSTVQTEQAASQTQKAEATRQELEDLSLIHISEPTRPY